MREIKTKNAIPILSWLILIIPAFTGTIAAKEQVPTIESTWKSLGGDFKRAGLSKNYGPGLTPVKWRFETDAPVSASITIGAYDRVHIPCEDGKLYTLDPSGLLLWSYDAKSPLLSSPTVGPDGTVYVGSQNGNLYAIDTDGNLRWMHSTDGLIYSSPAVSEDGNVYVCSQNGILYALGQNGSELWSFETKGPGKVPTGSIFASPAIADGAVYIAGLYDPNLYALDQKTGDLIWRCSFESQGWPFASPVIGTDGTIYQTLLYDTNLYAIEPNNGNIIWSADLADPSTGWFDPNYAEQYGDADGWSEPALGPDGTIYVSFDDPYLRAVDPNGNIKWVTLLGDVGGFTLTVAKNGLIYATSDDGHLYMVNTSGAEVAYFHSGNWPNFPVIAADNTIIVSDAKDNSMLIGDAKNTVWAIGCRLADLNGDLTIDFLDFALLATDWLDYTNPGLLYNYSRDTLFLKGDIDRDFYVDFADLKALSDQWLSED